MSLIWESTNYSDYDWSALILRRLDDHTLAFQTRHDTNYILIERTISNTGALALADALYDDLGLGWQNASENFPVGCAGELEGTYQDMDTGRRWVDMVSFQENAMFIYSDEVARYIEQSGHRVELIAYREPQPYGGGE